MRVLDLMAKDLLQLVRDWKTAAFLVVMPVLFTLLMGFVFGGFGGEQDPRLPVGVLNRDEGSVLSDHLVRFLEASQILRPILLEEGALDDLEERVEEEEWAAAVVIPAGYGERAVEGEVGELTLIVDQGSDAGLTAEGEIRTVTTRLAGAVQAAHLSAQAFEAQGGSADDRFLREALERAVAAWADPPLTVAMAPSGAIAEDEEDSFSENAFAHTSPGMMVQFAVAGLIGAAEILVLERKSRVLQRLLTTAISRTEIILGHFLAMFLMILFQLTVLILFGQIAVDVAYLRAPLATLLVAVTMALWVAALGLLIGVLAKTEDQVVIFAMIPMFLLAGLGGAWMPLEATPEAFQFVGHLLPSAWAMDGFENIVIRGLGLESVLLPSAIMLGYAVLFFGIAVWRFRFE